MHTLQIRPQHLHGVTRRALLHAGLAAGVTLSTWPFPHAPTLLAAEAGPPKRGGILRVRGWAMPHFDPHLTFHPGTHTTLSFVYSKLVRYRVGAGVPPGTFLIEPDVAERWETPDDTTYILDCCVLAEVRHTSSRQDRLLLGEQIGKDIVRALSELEAFMGIQDQRLHECLGLLTTRFPNGFDG
jgi:hypothetical protein